MGRKGLVEYHELSSSDSDETERNYKMKNRQRKEKEVAQQNETRFSNSKSDFENKDSRENGEIEDSRLSLKSLKTSNKNSVTTFKRTTSKESFNDKNDQESINIGINFEKYNNIPVKIKGKDAPNPIKKFEDAKLEEAIEENLLCRGYKTPTPIQKHSIPIILEGRDFIASAQTGSGKTAAYLLPMLSMLISNKTIKGKDCKGKQPQKPLGLIMTPTRELAIQVFCETRKFSHGLNIYSALAYGGTSVRNQIDEIKKGCHILISTPGRTKDFMDRNIIEFSFLLFLILDEADRMLDMGFESQIREIVNEKTMPVAGIRQTLMFSATFPKKIRKLASDFLSNHLHVIVGKIGEAAKNIIQKVICVDRINKEKELITILDDTEPDSLILIFVKTKKSANRLEELLYRKHFRVASVHGDRNQSDRELAINTFKSGLTPILVATDVCSRGLDIPNVKLVINYDLPMEIEDYVHRIGRTGRIGHSGLAISFFSKDDKAIAPDLVKKMKENEDNQIPDFLLDLMDGYDKSYKNSGTSSPALTSGSAWSKQFIERINSYKEPNQSKSRKGNYDSEKEMSEYSRINMERIKNYRETSISKNKQNDYRGKYESDNYEKPKNDVQYSKSSGNKTVNKFKENISEENYCDKSFYYEEKKENGNNKTLNGSQSKINKERQRLSGDDESESSTNEIPITLSKSFKKLSLDPLNSTKEKKKKNVNSLNLTKEKEEKPIKEKKKRQEIDFGNQFDEFGASNNW